MDSTSLDIAPRGASYSGVYSMIADGAQIVASMTSRSSLVESGYGEGRIVEAAVTADG